MPPAQQFASRKFTKDDQLQFAAASGDFNPMHMDAIAARRTQAGAPVVHGMHALLWLLDSLYHHTPSLLPIVSLKGRFAKMIYVGDSVTANMTQPDTMTLQAEIMLDNKPAVTLTASLGQPALKMTTPEEAKKSALIGPSAPINVSIENITAHFGKLSLPQNTNLETMFPAAARSLGARRIAALARSSYLVGMVVPGLHSIYGGLTVDLCEDDLDPHITFQVSTIDPRFNLVRQNMWGGGICAKLETFVRQPPVQQASFEKIAQHITSNEFMKTTALVIGGSRGLGELTAKIIAAGGGRVIITYVHGKSDAENLATEIKAAGGYAETMAYDVLKDADMQLANLHEQPTHIYYFATPPLTTRQAAIFSAFYVAGFEHLIRALVCQNMDKMRVFYPSSIAIDEQTSGMIDYAAAKAAGEELCTKLMAEMPNLKITTSRLPRMLTDLTATIHPVETSDPLSIMLPLVRTVQS